MQDPVSVSQKVSRRSLKKAKALLDELAACEAPVCEWIVSKRLGSPHRSGRRIGWPEVAIH